MRRINFAFVLDTGFDGLSEYAEREIESRVVGLGDGYEFNGFVTVLVHGGTLFHHQFARCGIVDVHFLRRGIDMDAHFVFARRRHSYAYARICHSGEIIGKRYIQPCELEDRVDHLERDRYQQAVVVGKQYLRYTEYLFLLGFVVESHRLRPGGILLGEKSFSSRHIRRVLRGIVCDYVFGSVVSALAVDKEVDDVFHLRHEHFAHSDRRKVEIEIVFDVAYHEIEFIARFLRIDLHSELQVVEYSLQTASDINVSFYLDNDSVAEIAEHYQLR